MVEVLFGGCLIYFLFIFFLSKAAKGAIFEYTIVAAKLTPTQALNLLHKLPPLEQDTILSTQFSVADHQSTDSKLKGLAKASYLNSFMMLAVVLVADLLGVGFLVTKLVNAANLFEGLVAALWIMISLWTLGDVVFYTRRLRLLIQPFLANT